MPIRRACRCACVITRGNALLYETPRIYKSIRLHPRQHMWQGPRPVNCALRVALPKPTGATATTTSRGGPPQACHPGGSRARRPPDRHLPNAHGAWPFKLDATH
eukprot:7824753-Pyramimonas_sp.AAC.1